MKKLFIYLFSFFILTITLAIICKMASRQGIKLANKVGQMTQKELEKLAGKMGMKRKSGKVNNGYGETTSIQQVDANGY